ncbi:MAG: alpha/beta fold hydrolase [Myxacorys chilensis ATA2-1-KO14]|nr:alpha/beta fold hydrolase [Myxacorys chilensis ATA2-1-KO14]
MNAKKFGFRKKTSQKLTALGIVIIAILVAIDNWLPYSLLSHYKCPVNSQPQILRQYGAIAETIQFSVADGTQVSGWWIPAKTRSSKPPITLILLHGLGGTRQDLLEFALPLWKKGINLAAIDLRGHGNSSGEFFTYGFNEWKEVSGLIDNLQQRGAKRMAVLGISAGGVVGISAAAHDTRIHSLVTIGAFADLDQMITRRSPWLPALWRDRAKANAEQMGQFRIKDVSAIANVQKITCPILITHGTADDYILFEDGQSLYRSAPEPKMFYAIQSANHANMLWKEKQKLQTQIFNFIQANTEYDIESNTQ